MHCKVNYLKSWQYIGNTIDEEHGEFTPVIENYDILQRHFLLANVCAFNHCSAQHGLPMPWMLTSPIYGLQWYWIDIIILSLSSTRTDCNLRHLLSLQKKKYWICTVTLSLSSTRKDYNHRRHKQNIADTKLHLVSDGKFNPTWINHCKSVSGESIRWAFRVSVNRFSMNRS